MNPSRLSHQGADEFEATLLRSARADGASANRDRTLAALALAATAAGAGAVAAARAKAAVAETVKGLGSLKWIALLSLGLAGGIAGLVAYQRSVDPADGDRAAITPPPMKESLPVTSPPDRPTPPPPSIAAPRAHVARPKTKPAIATDSLLQEVSILDRSRLQLSQGDAKGATRTAESYLARFPKGRLAGEAKVIRVRAALLTGGHSAAAPLAASFLREHPDSPHAPALRKLLQTASAAGGP